MRRRLGKRERFELFKRDQFTCNYCGKKPPEVELTIDHKFPVSLGGGDEDENLITCCRKCNSTKGNVPLNFLPNTTALNFEIPDELNQRRREQGATWREVVFKGLDLPIESKLNLKIKKELQEAVNGIINVLEVLHKDDPSSTLQECKTMALEAGFEIPSQPLPPT